MTVSQLIDLLKKFHPNLPVLLLEDNLDFVSYVESAKFAYLDGELIVLDDLEAVDDYDGLKESDFQDCVLLY